MVPVANVVIGITFVFTFHMHYGSSLRVFVVGGTYKVLPENISVS
jgi:hypothetical protein